MKTKNQPQPKHTKECLEIKKNKNMKYLKLFENFKSTIDDVIEFIQPSNPMDSEEYTYYCFGDDEAYYGGVRLSDYMNAIEGSVFREDSNTSKKFGWDFIKSNKEEILDRCEQDLKSSGIDFSDELEEIDESFENISEEKGEKWIADVIKRPGSLRKKLGKRGEEKISKGEIQDELSKLKKKDKDPKKSGVQGLSKRDLTKLRQLNLAKKLKGLK